MELAAQQTAQQQGHDTIKHMHPNLLVGPMPLGTQRNVLGIFQIAKARLDLVLTARRVDAEEALGMGLANRISAPGESVSAAVALGNEIAANAPVAVAAAKASLEEAWDLALDAALERERVHYDQALRSEDRLEGLAAFAEKRPPQWKGK